MAVGDQVPRRARAFVAVLLVAMCASALFAWEPWPLSSFRLFSTVRAEEQTSWQATTVDSEGEELEYPLGALPKGYRGFVFTMGEFASADPSRRDELCRTWVDGAPELVDREAVEVRIYLRTRLLSDRVGDRSLPGSEELRFICTSEGVEDAL